MKKFLIAVLMTIAICAFGACKENVERPDPSSPPAGTEQKGEAEFPNNEYGNDNEADYPTIWD